MTTITATYADWTTATKEAALVVGKRATLPILSHADVSASDGTVTMRSADLERFAERTFAGVGTGRLLLPVAQLAVALKAVRGAVTAKRAEGEPVSVQSDDAGRVTVNGFGRALPLALDRYFDPADFPSMPEAPTGPHSLTVSAENLSAAFKVAAAAAGDDWTMPMLRGVLLSSDGTRVEMAGTNRYRLAVCELSNAVTSGEWRTLIPAATVKLLAGLVGKVALTVTGERVRLAHERGWLDVRTIESTFPQYARLFPDEWPAMFEVDRKRLIVDWQAVKTMKSGNSPGRVTFGPESVQVEGSGATPASVTGDEGEREVAFNPVYMLDALRTFNSERVVYHGGLRDRPWLLTGDASGVTSPRVLLMPVRLPG